jgi:hypothetical protein
MKKPRVERRLVLLASAGSRVLLVPDEADERATWTLPYVRLGASASPPRAARALAARHLEGAGAPSGPLATFQHRTFSHELTYEVWSLELNRGVGAQTAAAPGAVARGERLWATRRQLLGLPLRAPTLKALKNLDR